MGAFLHIPTLLITAALGTFCLGVALAMAWRGERDEKALLVWGSGFWLATLAMLLLALRGHIPSVISIGLPNTLLLLANGLNWLGYRHFTRQDQRFDIAISVLGMLLWIGFMFTGALFEDINNRMFFISIVQVAYLLPINRSLAVLHGHEPLSAIRLSRSVIGAYTGVQLFRALYALTEPLPINPTDLPNNFIVSLTLIGSALFAVFLGLLQLSLFSQRYQLRFRTAAETDALTGLANRRGLHAGLASGLREDAANGALVIFDIDHFKQVNDTYGHLAGDRALVSFAQTIVHEAPLGSLAARIGGEEFALFLPDTSTAIAAAVAEAIRCRTHEQFVATDGGELRFTVSCGVAGVREAGSAFEILWAAADSALYKAKSEGRDRVAVHRWRPSTTQLTLASSQDAPAAPRAIAV